MMVALKAYGTATLTSKGVGVPRLVGVQGLVSAVNRIPAHLSADTSARLWRSLQTG
jgi:hypothetical protein